MLKTINRRKCTITEKAPTRAFSWLKAATTCTTSPLQQRRVDTGHTAVCNWSLLCSARWCGAAQVRGEMSAAIKSKGGAAAGAWWPALSAATSR